ncbi:MAG TPA: hypothetical protein VG106_11555, partial [Vicinamibacterales bacterium]|nr:hypothetical protein [Vicinamibacterales bacterium]
MRRAFVLFLILLASSAVAAPKRRSVGRTVPQMRTFTFDFTAGAHGWQAGHSDYSTGTADMRVVNELRLLPPDTGTGTAWYLSGWNYSDDLFLFITRR